MGTYNGQSDIRLEHLTSHLIDEGYGMRRESRYTIGDAATNRRWQWKLRHSQHAMKRCQQRGICRRAIALALVYGTYEFRQGMVFRVVRDCDIPDSLGVRDRERLRHLVVVLDESERELITCYRNDRASRRIRRKPKRLLGNW